MIHLGRYIPIRHTFILIVLLLNIIQPKAAQAQSITAASDGTNTVVNQNGQSFDIESGRLSSDGRNLFHSFETFQLIDGSTVNFLADSAIQRIFARITGNSKAFIDGTLQISNGQADLFLLNPAGIIFGPNINLKLPANLTTTTANGIGFANGVFNAVGHNNYATLIDRPTSFIFSHSSSIIHNEGDLLLSPNQSLTLLGGSIVNTGNLMAAEVVLKEVSGEQIIQVSQTGSLLNLEFSGNAFQESSVNGALKSSMLPNLLTNSRVEHADQIITTSDGQVLLGDFSLSTALSENKNFPTSTSQSASLNSNASSRELTLSWSSANGESMHTVDASVNLLDPQTGLTTARTSSDTNTVDTSTNLSDTQSSRHQTADNQIVDDQSNETETRANLPPRRLGGKLGPIHRTVLNTSHASEALAEVEKLRHREFSTYFGRDLEINELTLSQIQQLLTQIQGHTSNQSVIVYIKTPKLALDISEQGSTTLELLIFKPTDKPVNLTIADVSQDELFQTIEQFRRALISSSYVGSKRYLPTSQKLYQWLIKPIEDELGSNQIDTILFSMDSGLRSVPIAALHDGEQFLVEKYSVGMIPSLGLMNSHYQPLDNAQVLAMGASDFEVLQPLPAVPTEIEAISQLWPGRKFLNESFTQQNLIQQQQQKPAQIIHLATHAEFRAGNADDSYIQLWDKQLRLSDIHTLGWDNPTVELLVLSACRTALGDVNAEMGFAGLAVAAGVTSALASLWTVSDVGTLALMGEFYHQLTDTPIKSDALQAAQLAMLRGEIHFDEEELLGANAQLSAELQNMLEHLDLSHPYYWAGFTLIGSPW